jgi:hypothetical protein
VGVRDFAATWTPFEVLAWLGRGFARLLKVGHGSPLDKGHVGRHAEDTLFRECDTGRSRGAPLGPQGEPTTSLGASGGGPVELVDAVHDGRVHSRRSLHEEFEPETLSDTAGSEILDVHPCHQDVVVVFGPEPFNCCSEGFGSVAPPPVGRRKVALDRVEVIGVSVE